MQVYQFLFIFSAIICVIYSTNCVNDCSNHGECVRRGGTYVCVCRQNYEGADCSFWRDVLEANKEKNGTVRFLEWKYYNFTMNPGNTFVLVLHQKQAENDIDIFIQKSRIPTTSDYLIKDSSESQIVQIIYDETIVTTTIFYVGLFGFRGNTDYRIWYNSTGGCSGGCSGHGTCIRGYCICDSGYNGENCDHRVNNLLLNNEYRNIAIDEGAWMYYVLELQQIGNLKLNLSQSRGDVDIYIKYGAIPTQEDWDYADITNSNRVTIDMLDPRLGQWYFAFYGFTESTFTFRVNMNTLCPDRCSKHGDCVGSYCNCYLEYRGPACEIKRDILMDNELVNGYVSQDGWNYYRYSSNTANNFYIQVNHTSSVDCDIYVNLEKYPTYTEYIYKDLTNGDISNLRIDNPGTAVWYIGINGYTTCEYRMKVYTSNQCIGGCGPHGRCSTTGRCICDQGWTGTYCDERTNILRNGAPVLNQTISEGIWHYYQFTLTNLTSQLNVAIKEHDSEGFVWLFVSAGGNPTLISYDEADTETSTTVHRIKLEFDTPRQFTTFFIGVYGSAFALRDTTYDIVVWTPPFK